MNNLNKIRIKNLFVLYLRLSFNYLLFKKKYLKIDNINSYKANKTLSMKNTIEFILLKHQFISGAFREPYCLLSWNFLYVLAINKD